jgi:Fanconi anemia group M protein
LEKAAKSLILSIITKYKIPIIFTKDEQETAETIILMANKSEKDKTFSLRPSRSFLSKEEQKQFILEGFPGIGPITSQKLLSRYKTIKSIINAKEEELREILGKKFERFKELIES